MRRRGSKQLVIFILRGREEEDMAVIYATLIIKGVKTYAQVPAKIREQVKQVLIDLDCEHLVTE